MAGSLFFFAFPNQTSSETAVHEIPEMLQLRTQSVITESTSTSKEEISLTCSLPETFEY